MIAADAGSCPRCGGPIFEGRGADIRLFGCGQCGGVWLEASSWQAVLAGTGQPLAVLADVAAGHATIHPDRASAPGVCPTCGSPLARAPIPGTALAVHTCASHGVWVDAGDLRIVSLAYSPPPPPPPQPAPPRTGFVTGVAWIFIVLSALGSFAAGAMLILALAMVGPLVRAGGIPFLIIPSVILSGLVIACVGTFVISIALLARRPWARPAFVGVLLLLVVSSGVELFQSVLDSASPSYAPSEPSLDPGTARMVALLDGVVSTIHFAFPLMCGLGCAWLVLRFLSGPVRAEFDSRGSKQL